MEHDPFLSHDEQGMVNDLKIFNDHLPAVATVVGVSSQQVAASAADYALAQWIFDGLANAKKQLTQITACKNLLFYGDQGAPVQDLNLVPLPDAPGTLLAGIFGRYRALVKDIKANKNCTDQIKKDLGIVGAEIVIDPSQMKPKAKLKLSADNKIIINVTKGHADMIAVYRRLVKDTDPVLQPGQEETYEFVTSILHPPYIDLSLNQSKKMETRKYKFYYMLNDVIVGLPSEIIIVDAHVYVDLSGNELSGSIKPA